MMNGRSQHDKPSRGLMNSGTFHQFAVHTGVQRERKHRGLMCQCTQHDLARVNITVGNKKEREDGLYLQLRGQV